MKKSTRASKSSAAPRAFEALAALLIACGLAFAAVRYVEGQGWLLWFGDEAAHLNVARRLFDSRTPNYDQIGTVWLPVVHWASKPFARNDAWWQSGLAGSIPAAAAFAIAALFLFLAVRAISSSSAAAFAALAIFAANPNVLYLSAITMTEPYFFAAFFGLVYFAHMARERAAVPAALAAGLLASVGTLTRYECWFVLPFFTVYLLTTPRRRFAVAAGFAAAAGLGPLYWLAHNWWVYGNPLEFYNGYYSAKAIYERSVAAGMKLAPGDHDWREAAVYLANAARLCAGWPLAILGVAGVAAAVVRRAVWPVLLLLLPPAFYLIGMYSSGNPIYVPHLYPFSYYNTRYGLAALPLLLLGAASLVAIAPRKWRTAAAVAAAATAISPWLIAPRPENWICWQETQVNHEGRRKWTREAADYLRQHYKGGGIILWFGNLTAVPQAAGIPLREVLHQGNEPHWWAAVQRPDLFLWEEWAIAEAGDPVATAILRARRDGPRYECVKMIVVKGEPVIEIYRRASRFSP